MTRIKAEKHFHEHLTTYESWSKPLQLKKKKLIWKFYLISWLKNIYALTKIGYVNSSVCASMRRYFYVDKHKHPNHIYIYSHPSTDCFVVSQIFNGARHKERLKLGLRPAQSYVRVSIIPLSQKANHISSGILRH